MLRQKFRVTWSILKKINNMASQYLRKLSGDEYKQLTLKLHKMQNGCCFICQQPIYISIHTTNIDHIVPLNTGVRITKATLLSHMSLATSLSKMLIFV